MLQRRRTKSTKVYLTVVVLIALHLTETEASPLIKRVRWNRKKEVTDARNHFKPGVIVFGEEPKNVSVDTSYQADHPGLVSSVMKHQFDSMFPELLCGDDQMKFAASGRMARHFAMKPYPHLPLSHAPSSCGYKVEGNPLRLVFNAPYDGCDVVLKDGCYELPLLWNGLPVTLKCPKPDDPTTIPPIFPWLPWPLPQEPTTAAPTVPPIFPPGLHHHHLWPFPQNPFFPGVPFPPFFHKHPPVTTTSPPQDPFPSWWWWYYMYKNKPTPTTPPQDLPNWWDWFHMHKIPAFPTQATAPPQDQNSKLQQYWQYLYHLHDHKSPGAHQHPWDYYASKVMDGKFSTHTPTTPWWHTESTTTPWWFTDSPTTSQTPVTMP